jgi:organic hydroperoxide reductase OsmC/OhrA
VAYDRDYLITSAGKAAISGSSAPEFRGDPSRYNPEELLVAGLAACHMLWYLHLCSEAGIAVVEYRDSAEGSMDLNADGSGQFSLVTLRPRVTISSGSLDRARTLHDRAHEMCFLARSVNFPVRCEPTIQFTGASPPVDRRSPSTDLI